MPKEKAWVWETALDELLNNQEMDLTTEPTRLSKIDYYLAFWVGKAMSQKAAQVVKPIIRDRLLQLFRKHHETIERLRQNKLEEQPITSGEVKPPRAPKGK